MSGAVERLNVLKDHLRPTRNKKENETKKFRFTLDETSFNEDQRTFYEKNGFIVIKNLVSHEDIDQYKQRFLDLCNRKVPKGNITMMRDLSLMKTSASGERLYNKIQDFMWDDVLSKYIMDPRVVDVAQCFVGPNIMAMHTMLINKPPDAGTKTSRHPLHQDLHYFPFRPADRIVCSWTAMEKVTRQNGCLVVIPGTHRGTLCPHEYPEWENGVNKMYHGVVGFENQDKVYLEMEKGDTVFFHPILVHGSGTNRTNGFRKAISCHYAASECFYINVDGTTQDGIAEEVEKISRARGAEADIKQIWHIRSRLVRGQEINL